MLQLLRDVYFYMEQKGEGDVDLDHTRSSWNTETPTDPTKDTKILRRGGNPLHGIYNIRLLRERRERPLLQALGTFLILLLFWVVVVVLLLLSLFLPRTPPSPSFWIAGLVKADKRITDTSTHHIKPPQNSPSLFYKSTAPRPPPFSLPPSHDHPHTCCVAPREILSTPLSLPLQFIKVIKRLLQLSFPSISSS